jgi:ABC-2 type transport system permease protein
MSERGVALRSRSHPLLELTRARLLEFVREPEALFWVFVFPVLLALALGIAFRNRPPEKLRIAVLAGSPGSARIVAALAAAPGLAVSTVSAQEADRGLRRGNVDVVIEEGGPAGSGRPLSVTLRYDPARSSALEARLAVLEALREALGFRDPVQAHDEPVREVGSRYIDFLIPGLVGLNIMGSGLWGIGFAVVVARTRKLLKRFAVTPMRRSHYLLSFALSRLLFLYAEVAALIVFGWVAFGVTVHGSMTDLAFVSLVGGGTFSAVGLLVAARPTTIEGVSGWMNFIMLPMWLLSGSFFSYQRFPAAVQPLIRALPLTALNDALRAVMNQGAPLWATWSQLGVMVAWGLASFAVALRIFRWQ